MRQNVLFPDIIHAPRADRPAIRDGRRTKMVFRSAQITTRETKETISGAERECNFLLVIDTMRTALKMQRSRGCAVVPGGIAREMPDKTPLVRAGALECVAKALGDHARDNTVVSMGCWAIWSLARQDGFIQFDKAELCRDIRYGNTPPP